MAEGRGVSQEAVVEHLCAEQHFLRRLALALARDEASAQDLVQQTMVTAWQRSPTDRPSRAWLARVMRRLAGHDRRAAARRFRRERVAARREVEEVDQTIELHALVSREVQALPKAQARAIALRYGEGLGPSAIAERLDLPLPTVRSQLQPGLQRLRQRLDAEHGGNRSAWALVALRPESSQPARLSGLDWLVSWAVKPAMVITAGLVVWWAGAMFLGGQAAPARPSLDPSGVAESRLPLGEIKEVRNRATRELPDEPGKASKAPLGEGTRIEDGGSKAMGGAPGIDPLPWLSMELPEGTPEAYLHLRFEGSWETLLSGSVSLQSAGLPTRIVEFRGRQTVENSELAIRVPALSEVVITGDFDGLRLDPVHLRTPSGAQWIETSALLQVGPERAYLSLSFADGLDWEGERLTLRLGTGSAEAAFEMSMRQPTVRDGRLEVGWMPAGEVSLLLLAGSGGNAAKGATHGALLNTTLAPGEEVHKTIRMEPIVPLYLQLEPPVPEGLRAEVRLEFQGGIALRAGLHRNGSFTTRLTPGAPAQVLPGLPPGPVTLRVRADGWDDIVRQLTLHAGEATTVPIRLD